MEHGGVLFLPTMRCIHAMHAAGGGAVQCGWRLSLPVLDPAAVLTLAVFQQPGRSSRTSAVLRTGLLVKDAVRDAFSTTLQVGCTQLGSLCFRKGLLENC